MTNASQSCFFSHIRPVRLGRERVFGSRTKDFHRQMKEPDVRCYHLLLDQQPMSEQPQDWRNTPSQPEASTCKNLPLETTATLVVSASGDALRPRSYFRRLTRWYSFSGSQSQLSLFADRDFDWRTAMKGPRVND